MQPEGIYYYHLRIGHGVTLAYTITSNDWVQFSYAICSKRDQYSKEIGRDIATERLIHPKQNKVHGFKMQEGAKRFQILRAILTHFLTDAYVGVPYIKSSSWLRKMLKPKMGKVTINPRTMLAETTVRRIVNSLFPVEKKKTNALTLSF